MATGRAVVNAANAVLYTYTGKAAGVERIDAGGGHLLESTAANASLSGGAGNYFWPRVETIRSPPAAASTSSPSTAAAATMPSIPGPAGIT